jgi:hypothetical protein
VTGVQPQTKKLSKKKTAQVVVVSFSGALEPGPAQNLSDYSLGVLGKSKTGGLHVTKVINLSSAVYNASANTVTLTPAGKLPTQTLQLTITAGGTLDAEGRPIDGQGNGQSGSNFQKSFKG